MRCSWCGRSTWTWNINSGDLNEIVNHPGLFDVDGVW